MKNYFKLEQKETKNKITIACDYLQAKKIIELLQALGIEQKQD